MVINKMKVIFIMCILFVATPLWAFANDDVSFECSGAYLEDELGGKITYTSNGKYRGLAEITAQSDGHVVCAFAVFEAETHDLKDISYEIKEVTKGHNSLYTSYLQCDENQYIRLFVWQENLKPICPDFLFSPKEQFGSIKSALLTANNKNYNGFVNPLDKTVMFDVGNLSEEYLLDAKLFFETDDSVFPDTKENTFDLTKKLSFLVYGSNGEPIVYTVEAFNSETRRMYDCEGAKIYTSDEAALLWGGAYRGGAPGWVKGETQGGGAWFIEPGGLQSGVITVKCENSNDYLCLSKTSTYNDFILWSGDNKVFPAMDKIHASVRFRADEFENINSAFVSFDVGATDKIYLTAAQCGGYSIGYKDSDGGIKPYEYSPILEPGRWYQLDFIFARSSLTSINENGQYNGYGVYAYLNGEYLGKTSGVSLYPADYTGYITMNNFSDSTYSVFRLILSKGCLSEFSIDDICVTVTYGTDNAESSKCAADQRLFLATYYAGKNNN